MIEKLSFGRTGHESTRAIFGAAALGGVTQDEANRTLEDLLEYGVNHIDTAASYGAAEERIGPWMAAHRDDFFLATKTGERTYAKARDEIRRSLERLRVSQVDLLQLHCLVEPDEWDVAMGADGALRAAIEAREEGLVRFIGVTGHGVGVARMHLRSLERFDFDSVLLPYNAAMRRNQEDARDFEALMKECQTREVAVQTIKSLARGPWNEKQQTRATWYEPLEAQADIDAAVAWVLRRPNVFLNTPGDIHLLPRVLDSAQRFSVAPGAEFDDADTTMAGLNLAPLFV